MKTLDTIAGKTYVVMSPNGGTVTSADGLISETVEAGKQKIIIGTGAQLQLDDAAGKIIATFNFAPVGLMGSGGGTADSENSLPTEYIQASFLQSDGGQYIDTGLNGSSDDSFVYFRGTFKGSLSENGARAYHSLCYALMLAKGGEKMFVSNVNADLSTYFTGYYEKTFDTPFRLTSYARPGSVIINGEKIVYENLVNGNESQTTDFTYALKLGAYSNPLQQLPSRWKGTIEQFKARLLNGSVDFIPAVHNGTPCMYDKVSKQQFKCQGAGAFKAGFNLKTARNLAKLPEGGGVLQIVLPSNWEEDANVVYAINVALSKGWDLPLDTYDSGGVSEASTFGMRRILVRKTESEQGEYIDQYGVRWHIETCESVLGAEPEALGYEAFRSEESAIAYWELEPYVNPEEELLTEYNENDNKTTSN